MEKEVKKRRTVKISEKVDKYADILSKDEDERAIEKLLAEIKRRKEATKKRTDKNVEKLIKAIETVSYKKVLKEIVKSTKDKYLLKGLSDYQTEKNKENAQFLENIKDLLKSGEETDIRKVYELLNLDYDKIQKEIEEERLKEEEARKAEEEIAKIEKESLDTKDKEVITTKINRAFMGRCYEILTNKSKNCLASIINYFNENKFKELNQEVLLLGTLVKNQLFSKVEEETLNEEINQIEGVGADE